jgi:hypothetical protein
MSLTKQDERRIIALDKAIEYHRLDTGASWASADQIIQTALRFLEFIAPPTPGVKP